MNLGVGLETAIGFSFGCLRTEGSPAKTGRTTLAPSEISK